MTNSSQDAAPADALDQLLPGIGDSIAERRKLIPFSTEEYAARLERVRRLMERSGLDLLFVTAPEGMCYLHGYEARWYRSHSTRAWPPFAGTAVHVDHDRPIHFDFLDEVTLLAATSIVEDIRFYPDELEATCLRFLKAELEASGWLTGTVGLEHSSYVPNRAVSEKLQRTLESAGCTVTDGSDILLEARRLKSPAEIDCVEKAAAICDIGLQRVRELLRPGITELEVWGEMMLAMVRAGGEPAGLHEVVSTYGGHAISSRKVIRRDELVLVDPCGVYNRYHANAARAFWIGSPPDDIIERHRKAGGAFALLEACIEPGVSVSELNRRLRDYYRDAGIWDLRQWVGGYELGISFPPDWVGEWTFSVEDEHPEGHFEEGLVSNFESVLGTVLIDTFVVEKGGARVLGKMPYELIAI
jgi:Xaa-Pro aminopeptidase